LSGQVALPGSATYQGARPSFIAIWRPPAAGGGVVRGRWGRRPRPGTLGGGHGILGRVYGLTSTTSSRPRRCWPAGLWPIATNITRRRGWGVMAGPDRGAGCRRGLSGRCAQHAGSVLLRSLDGAGNAGGIAPCCHPVCLAPRHSNVAILHSAERIW